MSDVSINAPTKQNPTISKWVWYESNAALTEGEAVCYNWDYTGSGATYSDARRVNHVETPTTLNAQWFAGVAARNYSAVSTGQLIEIYCPGSVCNILCGKDTNTEVGVGLLTFDVTATFKGEFRYEGLPGAGSAQPLQTTTGDASSPGKCLALLQEGPQSGGVEVVAGVANDSIVLMVGGTSLCVGLDVTAGDCLEEVLDGTIEGLRKKVEVITTAFTNNVLQIQIENDDGVTLTDGAQDLDAIEIDAIGDQFVIEWCGGAWHARGENGATEIT